MNPPTKLMSFTNFMSTERKLDKRHENVLNDFGCFWIRQHELLGDEYPLAMTYKEWQEKYSFFVAAICFFMKLEKENNEEVTG